VYLGTNSCRFTQAAPTVQSFQFDCDFNWSSDHPLSSVLTVRVDLASNSTNDWAQVCAESSDGGFLLCSPRRYAINANGGAATVEPDVSPWIAHATWYAWYTVVIGPSAEGGDSFQGAAVLTSL
jgi:hypothetical protein